MVAESYKFDVLTATAEGLERLLREGKITSVGIVEQYLQQIREHNRAGLKLKALISVRDRIELLAVASALDYERHRKGPRGPLHGIPVIVKDNICSPSLNLPTTCGSHALKKARARKDAVIVRRLVKAGMIIIGKANLSEWANLKEPLMTAGWSAVGGQTQSPYVREGVYDGAKFLSHSTPAGSSSGCGAGVAAGFSTVSVGTESDGSLVQPATRAALYSLKATVGKIPTDGCQVSSKWVATSGPMAKSVKDVVNVLEIMMGSQLPPKRKMTWEGLRVGFVDPNLWRPAAFVVEPSEKFEEQCDTTLNDAISKIRAAGAKVEQPVHLINLAEATENSGVKEIEELMRHETKWGMKQFFKLFLDCDIRTLEDLIAFNEEHADSELPKEHPSQQLIINASLDKMTLRQFVKASKAVRSKTRKHIRSTLKQHGISAIMGPADGRIASVAAAAGFPVATVPLGFADFNGRAFGVNIIAPNERSIVDVMYAWEEMFPDGRRPPPMLVDWAANGGNAKL